MLVAGRSVDVPLPEFAAISYFVLLVAGIATTVYFIHMKVADLPESD